MAADTSAESSGRNAERVAQAVVGDDRGRERLAQRVQGMRSSGVTG